MPVPPPAEAVAAPATARLAGSLCRRAAVCALPSNNTSVIKVLRRPVESALRSVVGMMNSPGRRFPIPDRHLQGVHDQFAAEMVGHRPADHPAGEAVHNDG
jgi:hypothetical protein